MEQNSISVLIGWAYVKGFRMKKVLLIAYDFPPSGAGRGIRLLKFAKYLPEFGWHPTVVSIHPKYYDAAMCDSSLIEQLPSCVKIRRTLALLPSGRRLAAAKFPLRNPSSSTSLKLLFDLARRAQRRLFVFQDSCFLWLPFALRSACSLIDRESFSIILTSGPPHATHLVGVLLKQRYGLSWIADFRDAWATNPQYEAALRSRRLVDSALERKVVQTADRIVGTTDSICDTLRKHDRSSPAKFVTIMNGYDPGDIVDIPPSPLSEKKDFLILHVGAVGYKRTPVFFLEALKQCFADRPAIREYFRVVILGGCQAGMENIISGFELEDVVEIKPLVPKREAIHRMYQADLLWLLLHQEEGDTAIPAKLFEYLASEKPILATICDGEAAKIARKDVHTRIVDPKNSLKIKDALLQYYDEFIRGSFHCDINRDFLSEYDRRTLTRSLSGLFDEVASSRENAITP